MAEPDELLRSWHPVAASHDLVARHVFHGMLLGRELAIWRADDGFVNVWENRCLHRGVRLSIGINDGRELKCQYHGWRYANRTAGCTYIPAHPADAPARTIANRRFASVERGGLVWASLTAEPDATHDPAAPAGEPLVLRAIAVDAPAGAVLERLAGYRFDPAGEEAGGRTTLAAAPAGPLSLAIRSMRDGRAASVVFHAQPVDSGRCVIRGVVDPAPEPERTLAVLRHHNALLGALRDAAEAQALTLPPPEPLRPAFEPVAAELAAMPAAAPRGRRPSQTVRVARKWIEAEDVAAFELAPVRGLIETFQPGAHLDLHLPNGLVRQYSIVNGPGETASYTIAVKREAQSRGGSAALHGTVREGDLLGISAPRNSFPLRRDATHSLLIAGGIGLTPLIAMAQALHHSRLPFDLHVFARSGAHLPFADRLGRLGAGVTRHQGQDAAQTVAEMERLLADHAPGRHAYFCGPGPMLAAARAIAQRRGWPEPAVHFEYFGNDRERDAGAAFEVALARSALTVAVPAGRSILEVLRDHGVDLPSSCEQGACGTCVATVIDGEPEHRDVYLRDGEKRAGDRIVTCVSRARSARLVLDL